MSVGNGGLYVKNKQKNGLDLNMNFYELFEIFNGGSVPSEKPAPASMEDYLHKGERILSLLRERKEKSFMQFLFWMRWYRKLIFPKTHMTDRLMFCSA